MPGFSAHCPLRCGQRRARDATAGLTVTRLADGAGTVSFAGTPYPAGRRWARQPVEVSIVAGSVHPGAGPGVDDRGGPGPADHPGAVAGGGGRLAAVTGWMFALLPAGRAAALADGPVTVGLDSTDMEVYGRKKRGVAYDHQGQRVGRPHVASWAETEIVPTADLGSGTDDPRATAPALLRPALASLPQQARASGRVAMRADGRYFAGALARAAHDEHIAFAIGARRIAPLWRLPSGLGGGDWHDAIGMEHAQVAVADHCPDWRPAATRLLIRRGGWTRPRSPPARGRGAACMAAWLHQLTAVTAGEDILAGHGVRGGKAMIATLRWRLIAVPGRLIRHAGQLILPLPPGSHLLAEVLARMRALPAPA